MVLKRKKPTSPGQRHHIALDLSIISNKKPLSTKTKGKKKKGGRNHHGRITVRGRGKGHKKKYRLIDFKRISQKGKVVSIEKDPNRSAWIARIEGLSQKYYILAPHNLVLNQEVNSSDFTSLSIGNHLPLKRIPVGVTIHNIELTPGKGGQVVRSAGSSGLVIYKGDDGVKVRFPSGEHSVLPLSCKATIGSIGNQDYRNQVLGKAGRSRWLGLRPKVRGVAMNPIDHPHGGGEGRSSGGRPSVTPWGRPTKGQATKASSSKEKIKIS